MTYPTNLIFLDIDGVMVTGRHVRAAIDAGRKPYRGVEEWERSPRAAPIPWAEFDPECCVELNRVLNHTNAGIVVSSAWRGRGRTEMAMILHREGIRPGKGYPEGTPLVLDVTPSLEWEHRRMVRETRGRGLEIAAWLSGDSAAARHFERFAILDDDHDMAWLDGHFFACSGEWGLCNEVADMVIGHLVGEGS